MIRRSVAGVVLGISLLAASLAWSGYLALRTVLDPDRSREVAEELLDNERVRDQLASNLATAIEGVVPTGVAVPPGTVEQAAGRILDDPAFEQLVLGAFVNTHAAFLGEGDAPESLDLTPLADSARQTIIESAPGLADRLPPTPQLAVDLPTERIPNASPLRDLLQMLVPVLAIGAAAGALFALFTTTDRPSVLRRAGGWAIGSTVFYLLIGLGLPWLLRRFAPDQSEVLAAFLTAFLRSVVTPSIVLGIAGIALLVLSAVWPEGGGERRPRARREPEPEPRRGRPRSSMPDDYAVAPAAPRRAAPPAAPAPRRAEPVHDAPRRAAPAPGAPRRAAPGVPSGWDDPNPTVAQRPVGRGPAPYPDQARPAAAPYPDQPRAAPAPYPDQRPAPGPYPDQPRAAPAPYPDQPRAAPAPYPEQGPAGVPSGADRDRGGWMPPRWVEGIGWVLDPNDPKPPPANARWVEGVGHVVPGPPPGQGL